MTWCRWRRRPSSKLPWLILIGFLFVAWKYTGPSSDVRRTPQYDLRDKPRFLYRSELREKPDFAYESSVDSALRKIEERALSEGNKDAETNRTIWQIMLTNGPIERSEDSVAFQRKNNNWNYQLVDHAAATTLIQNIFSDVPDLAWAYNIYPHDVFRADLLRYLILWYYGGYYADMDVFPVRTIEECPSLVPLFEQDHDISLVLGVEIDEPYASPELMQKWHWIRTYAFSQYNIFAPRRFSPLLRRAITRALAQTKQHYHGNSRPFFHLSGKYDEATVLETTGPGAFTDAILDGLSETLPQSHPLVTKSVEKEKESGDSGSGGRVTWAPFYRLSKPLFVDASEATSDMGGLAVMPIDVWGNGQRHSMADSSLSIDACINHIFEGTWKPPSRGWWEYYFG